MKELRCALERSFHASRSASDGRHRTRYDPYAIEDGASRQAVRTGISEPRRYCDQCFRLGVVCRRTHAGVVDALRPPAPPLGNWPALSAFILGELGRFNTPNAQNVANLINRCLGLANARTSWGWRNCTTAQAENLLDEALALRHEIAHGVNPRPVIHNTYSNWLPSFMRRLARCTDYAVRNHLTTTLGLANPWPP